MFGFCVFHKYKVKIECKGSSYVRTDWEGDSFYEDFNFVEEHTMEGGELMEIFSKNLNDRDCIEFVIKDGKYCFGFFDPNNGSGCDKIYIIKEVVS